MPKRRNKFREQFARNLKETNAGEIKNLKPDVYGFIIIGNKLPHPNFI